MEPWEPHPVDEFLPGTESTWNDYWRARAPYDRAAHFLRLGSAEFLDDALEFLSERPRFSGSGYLAERMLKYLSRPELSVPDHHRIVRITQAIADEGYSREAWEAKRLLARLGVPGRHTGHAVKTGPMDESYVMVELAPNLGERALLDLVAHSLHEEGWSVGVTVAGLIADWSRVISWMSDPTPQVGMEEYANELMGRDAIELVLERTEGTLRPRLSAIVTRLDEEFRVGTEDDSGHLVSQVFRVDSDAAWWWRRVPVGWVTRRSN